MLPERYIQYNREQASALRVDSMQSLDPGATEIQSLNILGTRLARYQTARVTLYGGRSSDEPVSLGTARAEAVRSYLEEAWGIDRSRISISDRTPQSHGTGRTGKRSVIALSDSPELSQPTAQEQYERDFDPPLLKIIPRISANAGVKHWTIVLQHDGVEIARYSNDQPQGTAQHINWQIENASEAPAPSSLVAQLTVEDSLGSTATVHGRTPLTIERSSRIVDTFRDRSRGIESTAYTLLPFDYNSIELSKRNHLVLEEIAENTRSGARLSISGYSDRTGKGGFNSNLADARASQIASELRSLIKHRKLQNVEIKVSDKNIATNRFDNDLPEVHGLSRAVEVVVEQAE
jgi:outer membrane protein OmpA-like peptidoglycan-associated protein